MQKATACPDLEQLRRLAVGQIAAGELEPLLEHLGGCDNCAGRLATLPGQHPLIDLLRQAQARAASQPSEVVLRLVEPLSKPAPGAAGTISDAHTRAPAAQLTFTCPGCGKALKIQAELAGKKVKCPHCQYIMTIATPVTQCWRGSTRGRQRSSGGMGTNRS